MHVQEAATEMAEPGGEVHGDGDEDRGSQEHLESVSGIEVEGARGVLGRLQVVTQRRPGIHGWGELARSMALQPSEAWKLAGKGNTGTILLEGGLTRVEKVPHGGTQTIKIFEEGSETGQKRSMKRGATTATEVENYLVKQNFTRTLAEFRKEAKTILSAKQKDCGEANAEIQPAMKLRKYSGKKAVHEGGRPPSNCLETLFSPAFHQAIENEKDSHNNCPSVPDKDSMDDPESIEDFLKQIFNVEGEIDSRNNCPSLPDKDSMDDPQSNEDTLKQIFDVEGDLELFGVICSL